MILTANGKNIYVDDPENLIRENQAIKSMSVYEEDFHPAVRVYTDLPEQEVYDYMEKDLPKFKRIKNIYIRSEAEGGRIK